MSRTSLGGQLAEDDLDAAAFEIAFDDSQMGNITGEPVHVVDEDSVEDALLCVIAQAVEVWALHHGAAPAFVFINSDNRPALVFRKPLQFGDLGVDVLTFPLLLGGNAGIGGEPDGDFGDLGHS